MKRVGQFASSPILNVNLQPWRMRLTVILISLAFLALVARAFWLQGLSTEFLQRQGAARYARTLELPATRGKITDRNGVVLASSIPVKALWAIPEDVQMTNAQMKELSSTIGMPVQNIKRVLDNEDRKFVYVRRQLPNEVADKVAAMKIDGLYLRKEYKRFYPEGEAIAHVLGFTNIDDEGKEGIELAHQKDLVGKAGSRRVIKDRLGRVIEDVKEIRPPLDGKDMTLSIDSKIQYLAYSQLKAAVEKNKARGGAIVVLDPKTGEILALANLPTFDPNNRNGVTPAHMRNRAIIDTYEPGSTLKPLTVSLALELGRVKPASQFDTRGGRLQIGPNTISDTHNYGTLDVGGIITKSSNVGTTLISQKLEPHEMWDMFAEVGFGQAPRVGFPGTAAGRVRPHEKWMPVDKATMSYGYGLSVSLLQMGRAYTAFARDGDVVPLTFLKTEPTQRIASQRVFSQQTAQTMRQMLEAASGATGTAPKAQIMGYTVAGKTGTARKVIDGRYELKYVCSYVGFAPASNPRLVIAVMLDEPTALARPSGGEVAAPVFSAVMGGALRLLNVEPDAPFKSLIIPDNYPTESL